MVLGAIIGIDRKKNGCRFLKSHETPKYSRTGGESLRDGVTEARPAQHPIYILPLVHRTYQLRARADKQRPRTISLPPSQYPEKLSIINSGYLHSCLAIVTNNFKARCSTWRVRLFPSTVVILQGPTRTRPPSRGTGLPSACFRENLATKFERCREGMR